MCGPWRKSSCGRGKSCETVFVCLQPLLQRRAWRRRSRSWPAERRWPTPPTLGTLNFTVASGSPTSPIPTASFVYDDTTNTLTSYTVDWDGAVLNYNVSPFNEQALAMFSAPGSWCGTVGPEPHPCPVGNFDLNGFLVALPSGAADATAFGTYTVTTTTTTAVPEPGTLSLLGLGALGLWTKRRRALKSARP
jgi:PEP-CTERM motif